MPSFTFNTFHFFLPLSTEQDSIIPDSDDLSTILLYFYNFIFLSINFSTDKCIVTELVEMATLIL